MRATDMPLAEIRTYLALAAQGDATAEARRALLEAHRTRVQAQLKASAEALEVIDFKLQHFDELSRKIKLATADAHRLYAHYGFAAPARPQTLMEILRPDLYRTALQAAERLP